MHLTPPKVIDPFVFMILDLIDTQYLVGFLIGNPYTMRRTEHIPEIKKEINRNPIINGCILITSRRLLLKLWDYFKFLNMVTFPEIFMVVGGGLLSLSLRWYNLMYTRWKDLTGNEHTLKWEFVDEIPESFQKIIVSIRGSKTEWSNATEN